MREIKFRCWYDNQIQKVSNIDFRHKTINLFASDIIKIEDGILMQYTGLKDKNGVEIYEGDIIDIHQTVNGYNQFVVEYDDYKFSARYYNSKTKEIKGWYNYSLDELFEINEYEKEIEVIGNIYETKGDDNNANS